MILLPSMVALWAVLSPLGAMSFAPVRPAGMNFALKRSLSQRRGAGGRAACPLGQYASSSEEDDVVLKETFISSEKAPFVTKYPNEETRYQAFVDTESQIPFSVDTGKGLVWYYLSAKTDKKKIAKITGEMHNCRHCKVRMSKCAGYFGPDGYAVDLGGKEKAGPLYSQIEVERGSLKDNNDSERATATVNIQGTFIVSQENLDRYPRLLGFHPESGSPFSHLGLHFPPDSPYVTDPDLAKKITPKLLTKLWNGSMDGTLHEIITMLQRKDEVTGQTDLDLIKRIAKKDEVLRKDFWNYRIETVDAIQRFARTFKNGDTDWDLMSDIDKMHVRVFALLLGGEYTEEGENPIFTATSHVVDISKDANGINSIPGFMNDRSNPNYYMVQQVARANMKKSVKAPFIASLSWSSTTDLDGHVLNAASSEHIYYGNKMSGDGETYLNFDANGAGRPTKEPVETFTFNSKSPGKYFLKVNNYCTNGGDRVIPFTVLVNLAGEITTYEDSWDCRARGDNPRNHLSKMMDVCTIEITQEMIDGLNVAQELSQKQANRLRQLLPEFKEKFGNVTTKIADMSTLDACIRICSPESDNGAEDELHKIEALVNSKLRIFDGGTASPTASSPQQDRGTLASRSRSLNTFDDILRSIQANPDSVSVAIRGRNYYPSTITTHSCGEQLKTNTIVNSYIEEGKPPVRPEPDTLQETCRFEKEWSDDFCGVLHGTAVVPVKSMFYDGYFLSLGNTHLPQTSDATWCVGAGMYPTDLIDDNHKFREVWASLHPSVRPSVAMANAIPAIGVFLHRGKTYEIIVNGVEKNVSV